jgi:pyruvate,water dikinase
LTTQRRDAAIAEIEGRLNSSDLEKFRHLLGHASSYLTLREDRMLVLGRSRSSMRAPVLAIGRSLCRDAGLDAPDDAFFLDFEELQAAASGGRDLRGVVAERRAADAYWRNVVPPALLGPRASKDAPPEITAIKGVPASKGAVRAVARVVFDLRDAHRLQQGEVLVTRSTAPPWTPLFAVAGAVVTDAGGLLSHCAIVAREYGIPAVVGTSVATLLIPDGAIVNVDGASGVVTVEE